MSEYGTPGFNAGFNAGFGRPPPVPPPPPSMSPPVPLRRDAGGTSKPFLVMLLIISCVAVGALLNWGLRQRSERARLFERNIEVEQSYVTVLAKRNDLVSFLTDPRTQLYRLAGAARAGGRAVTVAWRADRGTGVLIGEEMPVPADGHTYALWHTDGARQATLCGAFRPEPGVTYYNFTAPAAAGKPTAGFRVSDEATLNPNSPGAVLYETR